MDTTTETISLTELARLRRPEYDKPDTTKDQRKGYKTSVRRILDSRGVQHVAGSHLWPKAAALKALMDARKPGKPRQDKPQERSRTDVTRETLTSVAAEYALTITAVPVTTEAMSRVDRLSSDLFDKVQDVRHLLADWRVLRDQARAAAEADAELIHARAVLARAIAVDNGAEPASDLQAHEAAVIRLHQARCDYIVSAVYTPRTDLPGLLDTIESDLFG